MSELEGDFDLSLIKKGTKFECHTIIHFKDSSKIVKQEFSNHKKLLKNLKILIKSSVEFHEVVMGLEKFKKKRKEIEDLWDI